jgi:hypothetical protein
MTSKLARSHAAPGFALGLAGLWFLAMQAAIAQVSLGITSAWLPPMRHVGFAGVVFGNGKFVAAGSGLTILTSTDGTNWICRSDRITNSAVNINFATETYSFGGDTLTLAFTDGPLPVDAIVPFRPRAVSFGHGRFLIACDSGWILTSTDGEGWSVCPAVTSNRLRGVTFGVTNFVAVGDSGTMLSSPDGVHWSLRKSPTDIPLCAVAYGQGVFVAVGYNGTIVTSPDGVTWTLRSRKSDVKLGSIAFGNGMFLAGAVEGCLLTLTSSDGLSWRSFPHAGPRLTAVSCANGIFFATGDAGLLTSLQTDSRWGNTLGETPSSRRVDSVAYGNGIYVAAGGGIHLSSDARSWCWQGLKASRLMQGYFIGRGLAVLGGPDGFLDSSDGVTWTKSDGRAIRGDVSGRILRTFRTNQRTNVVVLCSDDGVGWRRLAASAKDAPKVLPEPPTTPPVASVPLAPVAPATNIRLNGTNFSLNLAAHPGDVYRLQASTNLEQWVDLTILTNRGEMLIYMDRDMKDYPMRFYRLLPW